MNVVSVWLTAIQIGFIIGFWIVPFFFKEKLALVHKIITGTVVLLAYIAETIFNIMSGQTFGGEIFCVIIWSIIVWFEAFTLKVVKFIKNNKEENENQLK